MRLEAVKKKDALPEELEDWYLFRNFTTANRAFLIEKYQPLVYHVFRLLFPKSSSERFDLISEGTLGLIEAVDSFDYEKGVKFKTYAFYRIKGKMVDYLRRQYAFAYSGLFRGDAEAENKLLDPSLDCAELLESIRLVEGFLPELTVAERRVIQLIYLEGMSQEEVANQLGCTPANVSILRKRALRRLSRLLSGVNVAKSLLAPQF